MQKVTWDHTFENVQKGLLDEIKATERRMHPVEELTARQHLETCELIDRAVQHYHSVKVRQYLQDNSDRIKVEYLPKGSREFNAVEECWRHGKDHLLVSRYYPKFERLKDAIGRYYRTRSFKLDITKYL